MPTNYGNSAPVDKGYIWESKTDHDSREAYAGERWSPIIQMGDGDRFVVAPYLPFTSDLVKEFEAYTVIRRHKLISTDEQGFVVPANGILKVFDADAYYEARPLVYADRDVGTAGSAYGDWDVTNPPVNMNPFDGLALEAGDLNAQSVVTDGSASTDPTAGGIAGRRYVGVTASRFPLGFVTDKVLSRAGVYQYREYDPQRTLTVLTHRVVLFAERAAHRRNYGQATLDAITTRNSLVGAASALALASIGTAATDIPRWARGEAGGASENDIILPGDLVAADDAGDFVRLDVRVNNYNSAAAAGNPTTLEMNGQYPLAAMHAVVGRCQARELNVGDAGLALVKTYKNSTDVGGIGTSGVEKILTRGNAMTAGELAGIQATTVEGLPGGTADLEFDAVADGEYGLLIHLNLV